MSKLKRRVSVVVAVVLVAAAVLALKISRAEPVIDKVKAQKYQAHRPAEWAAPIEKEGLPNFNKISADIYRGAQPAAAGIKQLKEMGIKTIINLRAFSSDEDEIGSTEIGCENIDMKTWHPEDEDVARFLKIVTDKTKLPIFVHCKHGSDRTGLMCAIYRVAVCGWSKQAAVDEMIYGGFGFHPVWENLIDYFMKLDIEKLKSNI
jgi:protein tyrosine/serine phosphatase